MSVLAAARAVERLTQAGDVETMNALDGLVTALASYRDARAQGGQSLRYAEEAFEVALTKLAIRCKAAGSSAFQQG